MMNSWFKVEGLLIIGLREHSFGHSWLFFLASTTANLDFDAF